MRTLYIGHVSVRVTPSSENVTDVACDAIVVGARTATDSFELDDAGRRLDEVLDGAISDHLTAIGFKAKLGSVASLPTLRRIPATTVVVSGLGSESDASSVRRAAGAAARRLSDRRSIAIALDAEHAVESIEGALLASYRFKGYKAEPPTGKIDHVLLLGADEATVTRGTARAEATILARDLINEPASVLTPDVLAQRASDVADAAGLEITVWDEEELAANGMNGVLDVARGSEVPPRFIHLRHEGSGSGGAIALVGKGVTFDSGGLSLKDPKNMEEMKTDMSGAAAVIAAMGALPRIAPSLRVDAYIPAVENMPGNGAIRPGDVIHHRGGTTVEVLNTDAEGRLILGDALALACEKKPDAIVDVATLTGSILVALGRKVAGLFTNDDALAEELLAAAAAAGEPLWRMPLFEGYKRELESEVADMKNVGSRFGGSITAALFLSRFVADGIPWAHLDNAGTARSESDDDIGPKVGGGVATRTLLSWLEARAR